MATINQSYNGFAAHAREATEKSVEAFTLATKPFTAPTAADAPTFFPEPVQRYFHLLQRAVVANVELATKWTELVNAFSGANGQWAAKVSEVAHDNTEATTQVVQDSTDSAVDLVADISDEGEPAASSVTDEGDDQEQERALAAERAEAKHAHELAREPYLSLTKAELSALLAERGLPKTGTINTLVERLVSADAQ